MAVVDGEPGLRCLQHAVEGAGGDGVSRVGGVRCVCVPETTGSPGSRRSPGEGKHTLPPPLTPVCTLQSGSSFLMCLLVSNFLSLTQKEARVNHKWFSECRCGDMNLLFVRLFVCVCVCVCVCTYVYEYMGVFVCWWWVVVCECTHTHTHTALINIFLCACVVYLSLRVYIAKGLAYAEWENVPGFLLLLRAEST